MTCSSRNSCDFFSNCSVKFEKEKQETQLSCRCLTFIDHSPDFWTFVETLAGLTSIWYCLKLGHCWTHLFTLLMSVLLDTRLVQIWPHLFALLLRHYSTHLFAQLFMSCHTPDSVPQPSCPTCLHCCLNGDTLEPLVCASAPALHYKVLLLLG